MYAKLKTQLSLRPAILSLMGLFVCMHLSAQSKDTEPISTFHLPTGDSLPSPSHSTTGKKITRFLELGVSSNAYRGDLAMKYQKWSSSFHIGMKLNGKKRLNGHFNLSIGSVTGQNADYVFTGSSKTSPAPNTFFKTNFFTANYDLHVNLLKRKSWMVYLSQGVGFIRFQPKDEQNAPLLNDFESRVANETYNTLSLMLPTQLGAIYLLPNGFGVGLQGGWFNQQTDYVDNISLWGNRKKKDNTLSLRFSFVAPISFEGGENKSQQ